ncbi:MAG TPA: glycosyltransferase family 2 protein [Candidatus Omnitrophota bacterium]|nr:glycosyltransferase family 2 protein [Candidatus Omnitrophota bacterium]
MDTRPTVSVCVPAYNEQATLRVSIDGLIEALSGKIAGFEVIIVNDGSSDATGDIADELEKKYRQIRVIHHRANKGIGASYRDALSLAKYEYFTWFPADLENGPAELLNCLPYLRPDTVIVNHYRASDRRSLFRRLVSRAFVAAINALFRQRITYYNGLNIIPTKVLCSVPLIADGFLFNAETVIRSVRAGCSVVELSHALLHRKGGKSKLFSAKALIQINRDIGAIVSHCMRNKGVANDQNCP